MGVDNAISLSTDTYVASEAYEALLIRDLLNFLLPANISSSEQK
jgi:hypothetical protein